MAWKRSEKIWYRWGHSLCFVLTYSLFRPKIKGKSNLPKTGAYLITPNHRSLFDIPVLGCATFRPLRFMAKKDLFKSKFIKWYFETNGSFSVDRDEGDPAAVKKAINYLKNGDVIVIFPEGGRRRKSHIDELATGVGFIAAKTKVPIIPVGISGLDKPFKKPRLPSRPRVIIGDPITSHISMDGKTSEISNALLSELSEKMQSLYEESLNENF